MPEDPLAPKSLAIFMKSLGFSFFWGILIFGGGLKGDPELMPLATV
jgi:hypothetical protein